MKNRLALFVCLACLAISAPAFGLDVYKSTNASGVTSYSDTPPAIVVAEPEVVKMPDNPLRNPSVMRDEPAESSPRASAKAVDAPVFVEPVLHKRSKRKAESASMETGLYPISTGFHYYRGYRRLGECSSRDKLVYPFKEKTFKTQTLPVKSFGSAPIGSGGRK